MHNFENNISNLSIGNQRREAMFQPGTSLSQSFIELYGRRVAVIADTYYNGHPGLNP